MSSFVLPVYCHFCHLCHRCLISCVTYHLCLVGRVVYVVTCALSLMSSESCHLIDRCQTDLLRRGALRILAQVIKSHVTKGDKLLDIACDAVCHLINELADRYVHELICIA